MIAANKERRRHRRTQTSVPAIIGRMDAPDALESIFFGEIRDFCEEGMRLKIEVSQGRFLHRLGIGARICIWHASAGNRLVRSQARICRLAGESGVTEAGAVLLAVAEESLRCLQDLAERGHS